MADPFDDYIRTLESPASSGFAITPDDETDVTNTTRAIYVGSAGDVAVILDDDETAITFGGVSAGLILPVRVRRVLATGTTASGILGLL